MLQSLVVPALPVLQRDLHTSPSGAAWAFTSLLLSTSVLTPIAGRLGDMFGKKRLLVLTLVAVALGTLVSALATSLALMIVGRTIQGLGGAIFPLGYAIVREEFSPHLVATSISIMAAILGIGGGAGILLAGPILQHLGYHWLFWLPLIVIALSAVAAAAVTPESRHRTRGRVDFVGAALLSGWLVCLLLAVSQAPSAGWTSRQTTGLLVAAAVVAAVWIWAGNRIAQPLVDMRMMRVRGVWTTNAATLLLGYGMWGAFTMVPQFVQVPEASGYGFGASTTGAGLFLLPQTVGILLFSPVAGRLARRLGPKTPLVAGSAAVVCSFAFLAFARSQAWEIYAAMAVLGLGIGLAFTAMASLIVASVPMRQTGVASGMNTIMRTIGGAIAAEVSASVIGSSLRADGFPSERAFTIVFGLCTFFGVAGGLAALAVPGRRVERAEQPVGDPSGLLSPGSTPSTETSGA